MLLHTKPRLPKPLDKLTRNSFPGILCGIVILVLTGLPGSVFPHVKPVVGTDKVVHTLMYATFSFLCIWGYRSQYTANGKDYRKRALILAAVISILYGGVTELMQEYLVPTRTGDWFDFLADSIGTLFGISIFSFIFTKKK